MITFQQNFRPWKRTDIKRKHGDYLGELIQLASGEKITSVKYGLFVCEEGQFMCDLKFFSNLGNEYGPYGNLFPKSHTRIYQARDQQVLNNIFFQSLKMFSENFVVILLKSNSSMWLAWKYSNQESETNRVLRRKSEII